ncbi:glycosyltransferase family 2 protein [Paenibacillus sp. RC84]|uniref:glycosyltransferase family 2 protein n=1 Tax=Paenibacillus sp. RC84 TaxID=3156252 RepID=UPI003517C50F
MKKRRKTTPAQSRGGRSLHTYRNDPAPKVSVVIPVYNERRSLAAVIREAYRVHPSVEVIAVVNGSTDGSRRIVEKMGPRMIAFDTALGHDVGRAVGARAARGDIVLFTDGDIVIPAAKLSAFVKAVENGADVAMNTYIGPVKRDSVHRVILAKHALTAMLDRPDLAGTSLTTIPHALSRRAISEIGAEALAVPPKALALALRKRLNVKAAVYAAVGAKNPRRRKSAGRDPVGDLILGDHLEALHAWIEAAAFSEGAAEPLRTETGKEGADEAAGD